MKLISISSLSYHVKDLAKSAEFYETLGFQFVKREVDHVQVRLNWFKVDLLPADEQNKPGNANFDQLTYITVDDVDGFYKKLVSTGVKPLTEIKELPTKDREFVVADPDGYKFAFLQKK